jgi:nicotinate-nucleotide adenylyltransferase
MRTGILGGTFDPIHLGHLEAAAAAQDALQLDRVLLLTARTPPHRTVEPRASVFHRFAMTALAAADRHDLLASDLELGREGPSYTSLTLERLHAEGFQASDLFFILGSDAFAELGTWHAYPRLLQLANFAVVSRPGIPSPDPRTPIPVPRSATVVSFIEAQTRDVSSTDIRRRVATGEPIDGLVPPLVAGHIKRHQLYMPPQGAPR